MTKNNKNNKIRRSFGSRIVYFGYLPTKSDILKVSCLEGDKGEKEFMSLLKRIDSFVVNFIKERNMITQAYHSSVYVLNEIKKCIDREKFRISKKINK